MSQSHHRQGRPSRWFNLLIVTGLAAWAGPPNELMVDSGTEQNWTVINSQPFFKGSTSRGTQPVPEHTGTMARSRGTDSSFRPCSLGWKVASPPMKIFRKPTHAKKSRSIHHGYAPDVIVFGRHSRLPESVMSNESLPSHSQVVQEDEQITPDMFREMLQARERARRAFHSADNCDALRRAMLRRSCPQRGVFQKGQWVMIWKPNPNSNPQWIGPQRVVLQDDNHTVWATQRGRFHYRATEHVRSALSEEGAPDLKWSGQP